MNVRCPNCGAVFPAPADFGAASGVRCPLCLHQFDASGLHTLSIAGPAPIAPREGPPLDLPDAEDEFEAFGTASAGLTSSFGSTGHGRGGAGSTGAFRSTRSVPDAGLGRPSAGTSGSHDPFAGSDGGDPFAIGAGAKVETTGDVDFDALLGEVGSAPAPIKTKAAPAAPALEDDSLFGGGEDDTLFLANPNTSGALFDDAAESVPVKRGSSNKVAATAGAGEGNAPGPVGGAEASRAGERPPRQLGPWVDRLLLTGMVVLTAGIALEHFGVPGFGLHLMMPDLAFPWFGPEPKAVEVPVAADLLEPTPIDDTHKPYALEMSRLRQVAAARPDDAKVRKQLVSAYLDLMERAPTVFAASPEYKAGLEELQPLPPRYDVIRAVQEGQSDTIDADLPKFADAEGADADDLATAAQARIERWFALLRSQALQQPGLISEPARDPLRVDATKADWVLDASRWADKALVLGKDANNRVKLDVVRAQVDDVLGRAEAVSARVTDFVNATPDHPLTHQLLASSWIEQNELTKAAAVIKTLLAWAGEHEEHAWASAALHLEARLAHRRGRVDDQIVALRAALEKMPTDELTTVRLGRLLLRQKRAQECQKLLVGAKKSGMKSIAFVVALVEYWLWAHRYDDALAELTEATKEYPESIDLLFLRGQVEEKQQHTATARDFFAQVIEREPRHVAAALRLAELLRQAERLDEARSTLDGIRQRAGDLEEVLEPLAEVLLQLQRDNESRDVYAKLLDRSPSNRRYLLAAARLDLKLGQIDRALGYLSILRREGAIDRDGAVALSAGLASKGRFSEASETLAPFADREPNSIELNRLTGSYLLDAKELARAATMLERAHQVALRSGGDPETTFQYGRLALTRDEVEQGVSRMTQAIQADDNCHHYRFELAGQLLKLDPKKHSGVQKLALEHLEHLIAYASRYATAGNPVTYLAQVHRRVALIYGLEARWDRAIPHLRIALEVDTNDIDIQVQLGRALFHIRDEGAEPLLRKVIARRPGDAQAAFYLGLTLLGRNQSTEALTYLERASASSDPAVVEASYYAALAYRERGQNGMAINAFRRYLARAPKDHPYYRDARSILDDMGGR